ncbi:MAG: carboxypeptidase-like regulatory domain-containing protein [Melioribacteraceae bacterium]|nr:carboxypeptidase-like regulatory domain-containing protein [Melioribacteraceae bacterium]
MKNSKMSFFIPFIIFFVSIGFFNSCELNDTEPTGPVSDSINDIKFISGKVISEVTGYGLPGVSITINSVVVLSDSSGNFDFSNKFTTGEYSVSLSKSGYVPIIRKINISDSIDGKTFLLFLSMIKINSGVAINSSVTNTISTEENLSLQINQGSLSGNSNISITPVYGAGTPVINKFGKYIFGGVLIEADNSVSINSPLYLRMPYDIPLGLIGNWKAGIWDPVTNTITKEIPIRLESSSQQWVVDISQFGYLLAWFDNPIRINTQSYQDSLVVTTSIADCTNLMAIVKKPFTISLSNNENKKQIENYTGFNSAVSFTRNLVVKRTEAEQKKQLTYFESGFEYKIEFQNYESGVWELIGIQKVPQNIQVINRLVGVCHNQGSGN